MQKLALDALQEIKIEQQWEAFEKENDAIAIEDARFNNKNTAQSYCLKGYLEAITR